MAYEPARAGGVRFGSFEVDLRAGELRKHGTRIKLQDQPLQILAMLLERPGELVTREELRQKLWPADTFVDFDHGLNNAINRLREALCDSAEAPQFIETLPRRGYRFMAQVDGAVAPRASAPTIAVSSTELAPAATAEKAAHAPALIGSWRLLARFWLPLSALAIGLAALLLANPGRLRQRLFGGVAPTRIQSIAVLPLENLTGDATQEYFVDGMSDALITDLAQIGELRVISRTSVMRYKTARKLLPEIAKELNVDAVVEGTVARSGDRVRVDAQLIQAATDRHLWARSYERDLRDILALQNDVARAIAQEVQVKLTAQEQARLKASRPVNPEAYQYYLMGRFYLSKRTEEAMNKARGYFEQAIQQDPSYAHAYAGLSDVYNLVGSFGFLPPEEVFPKAKAAAEKALQIDNTLGEAWTSLASLTDDRGEQERLFKRAFELNPGYATAHHWYARSLAPQGRFEEALAEIRRAQELDPLSLIINCNVGEVYFWARQYDKAIEQYQRTLEMDPNYARTHLDLGEVYEQKGMLDKAIAEFQRARALGGENWPEMQKPLQRAYETGGYRGYYQKQLQLLKERSKRSYVSPATIAFVYMKLGDKDQAIAWLERAYKEQVDLFGLNFSPSWDSLRSDPRFQDLLRRVGRPEQNTPGQVSETHGK